MLQTLPTFTTWDDHEYWNNYPESVPWLSRSWLNGTEREDYIAAGNACLDLFQSILNPPAVAGRSYKFRIDPIEFFVLDVRTNRVLHEGPASLMTTEAEIQELTKWLEDLTSPGVLVLGQPLWISDGSRFDYNPPDFAKQYAGIWDAIGSCRQDLLVLSGDVHHSRVLRLKVGKRIVHEFVTSPACHIPSVWSTMWKRYDGRDRGEISFPPNRKAPGGTAEPVLLEYLMGTSVPETIGILRFDVPTDRKVIVSGGFYDLRKSEFPRSEPVDRPGWFTGDYVPAYRRCRAAPMFEMKGEPNT